MYMSKLGLVAMITIILGFYDNCMHMQWLVPMVTTCTCKGDKHMYKQWVVPIVTTFTHPPAAGVPSTVV